MPPIQSSHAETELVGVVTEWERRWKFDENTRSRRFSRKIVGTGKTIRIGSIVKECNHVTRVVHGRNQTLELRMEFFIRFCTEIVPSLEI